MFSNKQLKDMIIPLFMEQLLVMLVGLLDTFIVTYASEAAVSGVSLVNAFANVFIMLFTAMSVGGAVVVSQYLGRGEKELASEAVSQLLMISTAFSVVISAVVLIFRAPMLSLMFGKVEPDVMDACLEYLLITTFSFPALAIYNTGAAMYRSVGKTSVTMYISIISNVINLGGNILGVLVLKMGVAGVAYPTLIARVFSAVAITVLCFKDRYGISYSFKNIFKWNGRLLKQMLRIAVPNGLENGIFQLVKVGLSSMCALFGTYQIAANGIAQSIWSLSALASIAMDPAFITVIGQCMGAGEVEQAEHYFMKLLKITFVVSTIWNVLLCAATPLALNFTAVSPETKTCVIWLVVIHNIAALSVHPIGFPFGKGLRAAGDVKFTTAVTIFTSVGVRLLLSWLFAIPMGLGVYGIAFAMAADWVVRAIFFIARYRSGRWKEFKVI